MVIEVWSNKYMMRGGGPAVGERRAITATHNKFQSDKFESDTRTIAMWKKNSWKVANYVMPFA